MAKLISIVTVTLNNIEGLKSTYNSLLKQDQSSFEWIIIDGKSVDETLDFLQTTTIKHKLVSEPDNGIFDAMNKGIKYCKGEYILFLNAGDSLYNEKVISHIRSFEGYNEFDVFYGDSYEKDGDLLYLKKSKPLFWLSYSMHTHHQSIIYRREIFKNEKYDTSLTLSCDWELTARLYFRGYSFKYIDIPISIFERGGISQLLDKGSIEKLQSERRKIFINTINHNFIASEFLIFLKFIAFKFRRYFPKLYDRLIMKKKT